METSNVPKGRSATRKGAPWEGVKGWEHARETAVAWWIREERVREVVVRWPRQTWERESPMRMMSIDKGGSERGVGVCGSGEDGEGEEGDGEGAWKEESRRAVG